MQRMFLFGLLAVAAMAAVAVMASWALARPVHAEAPWCAVIDMGRGDAYWDCQYASIQQCRPHVIAGNRGFCNPNPRYLGTVRGQRAKHRLRAYR